MDYPTAKAFAKDRPKLPGGVIGIVLCESDRHAGASADRLVAQGASAIIAVGGSKTMSSPDCPMIRIDEVPHQKAVRAIMNTLFKALAGRWVLWLWNGEFFVFPFGETRTLDDLAAFLGDERRNSIYCYTLDLYAHRLPAPAENPEAAGLYFDSLGYHAFPRDNQQLRLFGGLGWRFEEMTPPSLQAIGRTAMLRPAPDTALDRDMLFGGTEYDSVNCPWHNNPTGAVMSLRRTRRIMAHPAFPEVAHKLIWQGSIPFKWSSRQLLELGMIEPGQWF